MTSYLMQCRADAHHSVLAFSLHISWPREQEELNLKDLKKAQHSTADDANILLMTF